MSTDKLWRIELRPGAIVYAGTEPPHVVGVQAIHLQVEDLRPELVLLVSFPPLHRIVFHVFRMQSTPDEAARRFRGAEDTNRLVSDSCAPTIELSGRPRWLCRGQTRPTLARGPLERTVRPHDGASFARLQRSVARPQLLGRSRDSRLARIRARLR